MAHRCIGPQHALFCDVPGTSRWSDCVGRTALWLIAAQARNTLFAVSAGVAVEYGH